MKTDKILFAFAITVVASVGLFATNLSYAEQGSSSPFAVLSSSEGPSPTIELVRGRGGGRFRGGHTFRGGRAFHRGRAFRHGHLGWRFGPRIYGGWGGLYYGGPYYWRPTCLDLTWDEYSNRWVCNYFY